MPKKISDTDNAPLEPAHDGTSSSAAGHELIARTADKLDELMSRSLSDLPAVAIFLDEIAFGERSVIDALGVTTQGKMAFLRLQ